MASTSAVHEQRAKLRRAEHRQPDVDEQVDAFTAAIEAALGRRRP